MLDKSAKIIIIQKIVIFRSNPNLQQFSKITKETIEGYRQSYSRLPYRDVERSILNKD